MSTDEIGQGLSTGGELLGSGEISLGFGLVALLLVSDAPDGIAPGKVRSEPYCLGVISDRLVVLILLNVSISPTVVGIGEVRFDRIASVQQAIAVSQSSF